MICRAIRHISFQPSSSHPSQAGARRAKTKHFCRRLQQASRASGSLPRHAMISEFPSIRAQRGPGRRPDESHAVQGEDSGAAHQRAEAVQRGEERSSLLLQGWEPWTGLIPCQLAPPGSIPGHLHPTSTRTARTLLPCRPPLRGLRQEPPLLWAPLQAPRSTRTWGVWLCASPTEGPSTPCRSPVHHLMAQERVMSLVLHFHSYEVQ